MAWCGALASDLEETADPIQAAWRTAHPEHPLWRMRNDLHWEVARSDRIRVTSKGDALVSSLTDDGVRGGFPEEAFERLMADPVVDA